MNIVSKIRSIFGKFFAGLFLVIIKGYKYIISPIFPASCRYYPSCSSYSIEAIRKFGAVKGTCLTIKRVVRCNPFFEGGHDPVPDTFHLFK